MHISLLQSSQSFPSIRSVKTGVFGYWSRSSTIFFGPLIWNNSPNTRLCTNPHPGSSSSCSIWVVEPRMKRDVCLLLWLTLPSRISQAQHPDFSSLRFPKQARCWNYTKASTRMDQQQTWSRSPKWFLCSHLWRTKIPSTSGTLSAPVSTWPTNHKEATVRAYSTVHSS